MENNSARDYGPITRDICDAVREIINSAYDQSSSIIETKCKVPEGYVRIPNDVSEKQKQLTKSTEVADKVKEALCAALPAGLATLGLAFNAPAVAVIVMTGAGSVASSFIQRTGSAKDVTISNLHLENLDLEKLSPDEIKVTIEIDQSKKNELIINANEKLEKICSEISAYEKKNNSRPDIEINKEFGEWVQQFLMYVENNQEDRKLQNLRNALINRLASMNIQVYDEIRLRADGKLDVPIQDYLYDKRENREDEYRVVSRPAVYSNRSLLARGEIL